MMKLLLEHALDLFLICLFVFIKIKFRPSRIMGMGLTEMIENHCPLTDLRRKSFQISIY